MKKDVDRSKFIRLPTMKVLTVILAISLFAIGLLLIDMADNSSADPYFDFEKDGFRYAIDDGTTNVSVVGCTLSGNVSIPSTVEDSGITYKVVAVGLANHAPFGQHVTSVALNENITYIRADAFIDASNLETVTGTDKVIAIGDRSFKGCTHLEHVSFPSVTEIFSNAFEGCVKLQSIDIPNVKHIYLRAFADCSSLVEIGWGNFIEGIHLGAFLNCSSLKSVVIPDSVYDLGMISFMNCTSLESVVLSTNPNFEVISRSAFQNCSSLRSIDIPANIKKIDQNGFAYCEKLSSLSIAENAQLEIIEDGAFYSNIFSHVTIPRSATYVSSAAFYSCMNLSAIDVEDGNVNYQSKEGILFSKDADGKFSILNIYPINKASPTYEIPEYVTKIMEYSFSYNKHLKTVVINNTITEIPTNAFQSNYFLVNLTLGSSVETIGIQAFWNCKSLKHITFTDSVRTIDRNAFSMCKSLIEVRLVDGLVSIGPSAFKDCTSLEYLSISDTVEELGTDALKGCISLMILEIGKGLSTIGTGCFDGIVSLKTITVDAANEFLTIHDGALYDKDFKKLHLYPPLRNATEFSIHESTETIDRFAFQNCIHLRKITVGPNVTSIVSQYNHTPFFNCTSLERIDVVDGNSNYRSMDGVLYKYAMDQWTLLQYPMNKKDSSVDLSGDDTKDVKTIGIEAFSGNQHIVSVVLPSGIETVNSNSFSFCTSLKSVIFPDTVVKINKEAFIGCKSIEHVYIPQAVNLSANDFKTEGYNFEFFTDNGMTQKFPDYNKLTGNIYVSSNNNAYTVVLDANGGTLDENTIIVYYDKEYGPLGTPVREGYRFIGWFTEKDGGTLVDAKTIVLSARDHTLYAHWEKVDETSTNPMILIGGGILVVLVLSLILIAVRRR